MLFLLLLVVQDPEMSMTESLTQDVIEQVAVILIRVETVLHGGGEARVNVAVEQLAVEGQKDLIYMFQ